jgi:very-short-patch-repair endonuclease
MKRNRVTKTCQSCGEPFEVKASHADQSFCSRTCKGVGMTRARQTEIEQQYGKPIHDLLVDLYHGQRKGIKQIARELGMSDRALWDWFDALDIPRRDRSEAVKAQWEGNDQRRAAIGEIFGKLTRDRAATQPNIATRPDARTKIAEAKQGEGNAMWKGGRSVVQTFTCKVCSEPFEARPDDEQRFCSQRCFRRHSGESGFERAVRVALTELGIAFVQEYPISRYLIDFYLPQHDVAIECDGDYWHSLPGMQERDARKDECLSQRGLTVIRLKEGDFHRRKPISGIKTALAAIF